MTLTTLFLGLGAVALLVGGIGIANVMVIAVIERRGEIGLRRALGATRAHIRRQFLTEAVILSALGGAVGVALGIGATYLYSSLQGWRVIIPSTAAAGGSLPHYLSARPASTQRCEPPDSLRPKRCEHEILNRTTSTFKRH